MSFELYVALGVGLGLAGLLGVARLKPPGRRWLLVPGAALLAGTALFAVVSAPQPQVVLTPADLPLGQELYLEHCTTCHGAVGQGSGVAPALNDDEWLHGSSPTEVTVSIAAGFPGTGCEEWAAVLGEQEVPVLAEFVLSLGAAD